MIMFFLLTKYLVVKITQLTHTKLKFKITYVKEKH